MAFKIILTPQSQEDLKGIVTFIARDNPERARTFGYELINRAESIVNHPELGCVVPEIADEAVREMVHGRYRIIYEILPEQKAIYILRFWHGARGEPDIRCSC